MPTDARRDVARERARRRSSCPATVVDEVPDEIQFMSGPGDILVCSAAVGTGGVRRADRGRPTPREPRFDDASLRLARGIGDLTALALGNARRISELERFHRLVESLDAVFWEAERRHPARHVPRRPGRRPLRRRTRRRWRRPAVGRPHHRRRPLAAPSPRSAARSPTAPTRARSTGSARRRRRRAVAPRSRDVVPGRQGARQVRGLMRRRHRTQARRTGAARLRAQVLGGIPARARGRAAAPRARRDEEHVPGGGVARSADAAHLDPGLGADAGAEPARDAAGRRAGPRAPRRVERAQARAVCSAICWTSTVCNAGSCRPSVARPTSAR